MHVLVGKTRVLLKYVAIFLVSSFCNYMQKLKFTTIINSTDLFDLMTISAIHKKENRTLASNYHPII